MGQALTGTGDTVVKKNKVPDLKEFTVWWRAYVPVVVYKCIPVLMAWAQRTTIKY